MIVAANAMNMALRNGTSHPYPTDRRSVAVGPSSSLYRFHHGSFSAGWRLSIFRDRYDDQEERKIELV
jgi:hypothetical protein